MPKSPIKQMPDQGTHLSRRSLLGLAGACSVSLFAGPSFAFGRVLEPHSKILSFHNLHTGESLRTEFWADGQFIPEALGQINRILRDHRSNEIKPIDPELLNLLHELRDKTGTQSAFQVISGYRSPASNAMLHAHSGGVANRSLHMSGKAIDIALPDRRLTDLRRAALSLRAGGVGYYPASGFVHVDTGRVRQWS